MRKLTVDAKGFDSKLELHNSFRAVLGRENYWGNNLDSLHDCLTMVFEPTTIVVKNWSCAARRLGDYADRLWHVLDDSVGENPNLRVEIE